MAPTNRPGDELPQSAAPDLRPLYPPYLAAFNEHSWPEITKYISPTCHGTLRGQLSTKSIEEMRPYYEKDFVRCDRHEITIKEMKQIERSSDANTGEEVEWKKGIRWGLQLILHDPTMARTLIVNYWYRLENEKWMQCWHEFLDSVADEAAS